MSAVREKYYAIRIGDPRRHRPYFKLGSDYETAWLFTSRDDAKKELECSESPELKVVRVELRECR